MSDVKAAEDRELKDQELEIVHGGQNFAKQDGAYYEYVGSGWPGSSDWDKCYLCPKCGRPVHFGAGFRYYCDPCDDWWFNEEKLRLDLSQGMWKEISEERYLEYRGQ